MLMIVSPRGRSPVAPIGVTDLRFRTTHAPAGTSQLDVMPRMLKPNDRCSAVMATMFVAKIIGRGWRLEVPHLMGFAGPAAFAVQEQATV